MKKLELVKNDSWLEPFEKVINQRYTKVAQREKELTQDEKTLSEFATGYLYFGMHKTADGWVLREWAPNATAIYLIGDFNQWEIREEFAFKEIGNHNWQIVLPHDSIKHGDLYKLIVK